MRVLKLKKWKISLYHKGKDFLVFRNCGPFKNKYYLITQKIPRDSEYKVYYPFNEIIELGSTIEYSNYNIFEISKNYLNHYWLIYRKAYKVGNDQYEFRDINIRINVTYINKIHVLSLLLEEE